MKSTGIQPGKLDCFEFPTVRSPTEKGCSNTLNMIPYNNVVHHFGPRGYRGVDVPVPQAFRERDPPASGCNIALDTENRAVIPFKWNNLWLLGTVINSVCVRQGKGGIYHWNVGDKKGLIGIWNEQPIGTDTA